MVGFDLVIEILHLAVIDGVIQQLGVFQLPNGLAICRIAICVDDRRGPVATSSQSLGQESPCGTGIAALGQIEVNRPPAAVDRSEQIQPFTADLYIRFVDSPRATRIALIPADQLLRLGSVGLDPTIDGGVMNFEAALLHHFRQMPITDVEL